MSNATTDSVITQAIQRAMLHHQAGRLAQAEDGYRFVLSRQPNHPKALEMLGVIAHQVGRNDFSALKTSLENVCAALNRTVEAQEASAVRA